MSKKTNSVTRQRFPYFPDQFLREMNGEFDLANIVRANVGHCLTWTDKAMGHEKLTEAERDWILSERALGNVLGGCMERAVKLNLPETAADCVTRIENVFRGLEKQIDTMPMHNLLAGRIQKQIGKLTAKNEKATVRAGRRDVKIAERFKALTTSPRFLNGFMQKTKPGGVFDTLAKEFETSEATIRRSLKRKNLK